MPWNTAWSGAGVIVASSVQVVDSNNVVVASITPNGDISGKTVSASGDILLKGSSLTTIIGNLPKGIQSQTTIAAASLPAPTVAIGTATDVSIMSLDTVLNANRCYRISIADLVIQSLTAANLPLLALIEVHYTTDGTTPTVASNKILQSWGLVPQNAASAFCVAPGESILVQPTVQTTLRLLVSGQTFNEFANTGPTFKIVATGVGLGAGGMSLIVEDMGALIPDTGVYLNGAGGASTPVLRTFQTLVTDSQSFTGSGPASSGSYPNNTDVMYFGQDPGFSGNGNWRSYAWFNTADTSGGNGLGSLANMSGVAAANVSYLDIFINTAWWYPVAGGTLFVGHTVATPTHSTEPAPVNSVYNEKQVGYSSRGQGQWFSVLGTGIATAILTGNFKGVVLGPGNNGNFNDYGYANGFTTGPSPQIRAGYFK